MEIGLLVKQSREKCGLSMNALARRSGVGQSGLSEIEAGKRQPTFEVLERIVKGLNMTLPEFFAEEAPELPPDIRYMVELAQRIPPTQRKRFVNLLESIVDDPSSVDL